MSRETVNIPVTESVADLSKVDRQLAALYQRVAGAEAGAPTPTVRTALFSLIAYAGTEEDAEEAARSVSEIVGSHPCRAIVVDAMPPQPQEAETSVSVVCGITERGDRRLCGDVIRLHLHEGGAAVVGSIIPLLVSDVPVVLWIVGEIPGGSEAFDELVVVSDSFIVDSRRFGDLQAGLDTLTRLSIVNGTLKVVQDLAWVSLRAWRELTAEHFDPPVVRHYVSELIDIELRFAPIAPSITPPSAPLLFASWLMERMGVKAAGVQRIEDDRFRIDARQGERPVTVQLIPNGAGFAPGQPVSLIIRCGDPGNPATFTTQGVSQQELTLTQECRGICFPPKTLEVPMENESGLAAQALDLYRRDRIYEAVVETAMDLLEMIAEGTEQDLE